MINLTAPLVAIFTAAAIVLTVDLIATALRRRARRAPATTEPVAETMERSEPVE